MDLHLVVLLLGAVLVKEQNDVGGQDLVTVFLKMRHLIGHMGMDGGGELNVAWTDVDLHGLVVLFLLYPIYGRKGDHATKMRNRAEGLLV